MCDCNELEQVGVQGPYALLERAVKRIEEKDELIRQLQERIDALETMAQNQTFNVPVVVVLDEIPPGFYEGQVVDETLDQDDYEVQQDMFYGYAEDNWGFDDYGYEDPALD